MTDPLSIQNAPTVQTPVVQAQVPQQTPTNWESCDNCNAPLAREQRYCVVCGAHRSQSDDPTVRYLAQAARNSRQLQQVSSSSESSESEASSTRMKFAVILALIPVAAAIGIVVGRGATTDNELLLQALKSQKPPVVNVGAGGAAATNDEATSKAAAKSTSGGSTVKDDNPNDANGNVIARSSYGSARQLTGAKPNAAQRAESKKALDKIVNSRGKEYVDSQRGLPDQIIVP